MVRLKKILPLLLFLFIDVYFCCAQTPGEGDENRVEAVKMAYIKRELNLTPEEAQNFWPVYNNYVNEIKQAKGQYPNDEVAYEKKIVEIKERYQGNFKKVLGNNNQRANKVYTTDKQFNNTLRNELRNRQQQQRQQDFQPQQNQKQPGKANNPVKNNNGKTGSGAVKKPHHP